MISLVWYFRTSNGKTCHRLEPLVLKTQFLLNIKSQIKHMIVLTSLVVENDAHDILDT